MYPVTQEVAALFDAEQPQKLRITGTDENGNAIEITDADIMLGSFSIDRYSNNGSRLELGTAIAAEMSLKLNNASGKYDGIRFEGAELFAEIGIADWTQTDPEITWIPCGYFTCDEQPRKRTIITLSALDRMMYFDKTEPVLSPWTTETGAFMTNEVGERLYFVTSLAFPATVAEIVEQICARCGVEIAGDISELPNADYVLTERPAFEGDVTYRNIIQWCAGLMGCNAFMDWNGQLRFSWYTNTGYNSTPDRRFTSDLYENDITITGVKYTDADDHIYIAGTDAYALDLTGNELVNVDSISTILQNVYRALNGFTYRPFEAEVIAAPWLFPMDRVTFTDIDGNGHVSLLTNVNIGVNSRTALAGDGETAKASSYAAPSGLTTAQKQAVSRVTSTVANEAVGHATEMITGGLGGYVVLSINEQTGQTEEILIMDSPDKETAVNVWRFNQGGLGHSSNGYEGPYNDIALTADGQINADMITTGYMDADRITAGTITASKLTPTVQGEIMTDTQTVYISVATGATVNVPVGWVNVHTPAQNTWTTTRPQYDPSYPLLYIAEQSRTIDGEIVCTTPVIDQTTTVIDGSHITTGTIDANLLRTGVISSTGGTSTWNLATGQLSMDGSFTTSITVTEPDPGGGLPVEVTYTMSLKDGKLVFYVDGDEVGALEFAGGGLSLTGTDTTNPSVSNYVTNSSGEATGGAAVSANQSGALTLTCDSLRIGSVGQIPFDVGLTDTINVGGVTLVFKNGILVEAY